MFEKLCINDIDIKGKRVLIRVDFNVPLSGEGEVTDDTRIRESLPTINYAIQQGAKVILMSHLGRPKGKVVPSMSLKPAAGCLSELLGKDVLMAEDCIGESVVKLISGMKDQDVVFLENLRFHKEEEENDEDFSQKLAELADVYVNDAFGSAHRAHSSTSGITKFMKFSVSGFLMKKEIEFLGKALTSPDRPFVAIIGGAKVSDKIGIIKNLIGKVDSFIIGGGMAYTFLQAAGVRVGDSMVEEDKIPMAEELRNEAETKGLNFLLPVDHVIATKIDASAETKVVCNEGIPDGWRGLDIGPQTIELFKEEITKAKTILWNGPMGVFEVEPFSKGTLSLARAVADSKATSIVGGGDTVAAVKKADVSEKISHISTGGGASLEFLEGLELPGIAALTNK